MASQPLNQVLVPVGHAPVTLVYQSVRNCNIKTDYDMRSIVMRWSVVSSSPTLAYVLSEPLSTRLLELHRREDPLILEIVRRALLIIRTAIDILSERGFQRLRVTMLGPYGRAYLEGFENVGLFQRLERRCFVVINEINYLDLHHHLGQTHPGCFVRELGISPVIVALQDDSSNLDNTRMTSRVERNFCSLGKPITPIEEAIMVEGRKRHKLGTTPRTREVEPKYAGDPASSLLLALPLELRCEIYSYLIDSSYYSLHRVHDPSVLKPQTNLSALEPIGESVDDMLELNKQISLEFRKQEYMMFSKSSEVILSRPEDRYEPVERWKNQIGLNIHFEVSEERDTRTIGELIRPALQSYYTAMPTLKRISVVIVMTTAGGQPEIAGPRDTAFWKSVLGINCQLEVTLLRSIIAYSKVAIRDIAPGHAWGHYRELHKVGDRNGMTIYRSASAVEILTAIERLLHPNTDSESSRMVRSDVIRIDPCSAPSYSEKDLETLNRIAPSGFATLYKMNGVGTTIRTSHV